MIRLLIVEDSVTQREIFRRLLSNDPEIIVIAEARNGAEALEKVRKHKPDVVLMDVYMPDMDGITATRAIMNECPVPIVVVSATLRQADTDLAVQAYNAGAVSVLQKPEGAVLLHLHEMAPELRRELIAASKADLRNVALVAPSPTPAATSQIATAEVDVIGICASTGGPITLLQILSGLPQPYSIPILLVQHISHGFEAGFAKWLSQMTGQRVDFAAQGQRMSPGIWLSPGGRHLTLGRAHRFEIPTGTPAEIHCPSGDRLFQSLAKHAGPKSVGIQLTGMGDDGAAGLLALRQAGGITILQEESSCLIWGMPKAAQKNGAGKFQMTPAQIAEWLTRLRSA